MAETAKEAPAADTDLPKAVIKRIFKSKLDALGEGNIQLHRDATLALGESAKVLINLLTATSNDICKEKKRQTIGADDVLQALEDLEFDDLVAPLQVALDGAAAPPACCPPAAAPPAARPSQVQADACCGARTGPASAQPAGGESRSSSGWP